MRRLYLKIYAAFIAVLLLFGVLLSAAWWLLAADNQENRTLEGMGVVLGEVLPVATTPSAALQAKVDELAELFRADLSVLAADGTALASSGDTLPAAGAVSLARGHRGRELSSGPACHASARTLAGSGGSAWCRRTDGARQGRGQ